MSFVRLLAAAVVSSVVVAIPSAPSAVAVDPSPITLWAPEEITLNVEGGFVYQPLGVRVVAVGEDFQLWSHRPDWDSEIETTWKRESGDVALPTGTLQNFQGLPAFVKVTIRTMDGTWVKGRKLRFCPSYDSARVAPEGAATNKYPKGCPFHPFTVGSVMGIPEGWSTGIIAEGMRLKLPTGDYKLTAKITAPYADLFGVDADSARVDYIAHVVNDVLCYECEGLSAEEQHWNTIRRGDGPVSPRVKTSSAKPGPRPLAPSEGFVAPEQPDLQSLPAFGMTLSANGNQIRFAATVWNAGDSPLVVDGFRSQSDPDVMDAYQYFFDIEGNQTGYQQVGEFHWHAENHNHWHYEDFARYRLLTSDLSEAVRSSKNSFCLAATDAVDYTVPGADWNPYNTDLSTACGSIDALSIREVLQSGSGDTYFQYRAGQSFSIKNLPDGDYWVAVEANPQGALVESNTDNNTALRKITLGHDEFGTRTLEVHQVGIIDDLTGWFQVF